MTEAGEEKKEAVESKARVHTYPLIRVNLRSIIFFIAFAVLVGGVIQMNEKSLVLTMVFPDPLLKPPVIFTDRSKAAFLLWFIFICWLRLYARPSCR